MGLLKSMQLTTKMFTEAGHSQTTETNAEEDLHNKTQKYMDDYNRNNPNNPIGYNQALRVMAPTVQKMINIAHTNSGLLSYYTCNNHA